MTKPPILKPAIATDSRQNWTKGVSQTLLKCLSIYTKICPAWEIFIEPLFDDVHAKLTEMFTMPRCPPATKGMSAWLIEIHFLIHKHKYWYDTLSYCLSSPYILLSEPSNYIFTHKTEGYTIKVNLEPLRGLRKKDALLLRGRGTGTFLWETAESLVFSRTSVSSLWLKCFDILTGLFLDR